jgi:hypothetical protein
VIAEVRTEQEAVFMLERCMEASELKFSLRFAICSDPTSLPKKSFPPITFKCPTLKSILKHCFFLESSHYALAIYSTIFRKNSRSAKRILSAESEQAFAIIALFII